jgi:hypothetical protein
VEVLPSTGSSPAPAKRQEPNTGTTLRVRRYEGCFSVEANMGKAEELRQNAENCEELAKVATNEPQKKRLERMADGWQSVAKTQAWLDGESDSVAPKT